MRRDARILLTTACLGAAIHWGDCIPDVLIRMDAFMVRDVQVRGQHFLGEDEIVSLLGIGPETSVWGDTDVWAERLVAHPLIRDAKVTRRLPDGLLVQVWERKPVALAPTPTLEPVDAEGYRLPLDPAVFRLDLPIISTDRTPPPGSRVFPEEVRRLAAELDHLMASDTSFIQLVSSVEWAEQGGIVARWTDPPVDFLLPAQASPVRLREGLGALEDAVTTTPDRPPTSIDLRFADQVVVRRTSHRRY